MSGIGQHWGWSGSPFDGQLDPQAFYRSATHDEALARLHYVVEHHQRLAVLAGPWGSGKTLVLSRLVDELAATTHVVVRLNLLGLSLEDLLLELAGQFGLNPRPDWPLPHLWRRVTDRLKEHRYQQLTTVVMLDDAHEASSDALMGVQRLVQYDESPDARLSIILACHEQCVARLGQRLRERCTLRIDLQPWQTEETLDFVQRALERVQAIDTGAVSVEDVFSPEALQQLHDLSAGIPRRINHLAQWSLLAGAGLELPQIDAETLASAAEEMGVD